MSTTSPEKTEKVVTLEFIQDNKNVSCIVRVSTLPNKYSYATIEKTIVDGEEYDFWDMDDTGPPIPWQIATFESELELKVWNHPEIRGFIKNG